MAAPLQYLHAQHPPVIHRDFKPDNILGMRCSNGKIQYKIADFGVARVLSKNAYGEYYAQTDIGTPIYMAPEALAVCMNRVTSTQIIHLLHFYPIFLFN